MICVVTSVQPPTAAMRALARDLARAGASLLVVGDAKGPQQFDLDGAELFSIEEQARSPFALARLLGRNHYARKNLGYLLAISRGAACIYETDDDNAPRPGWRRRELEVMAEAVTPRRWLNVYRLFSDALIWPRGFPLSRIRDPETFRHEQPAVVTRVTAPVQQGLANGSPDVDAIWRVVLDAPVEFAARASVLLPPNTWCPFNSQSTWWWPEAYPLMYLPSTCSFRLTDIWRGFVAQRCLWALGRSLVFHAPEVHQERNPHDLAQDFAQEALGYVANEMLVQLLEELRLAPGPRAVAANLRACYAALVARGFVGAAELGMVDAWIKDVAALTQSLSLVPSAQLEPQA